MTLKEEIERLRGEPIGEFVGDPMDIPCIETSDAEALCRHPVVSVHMLTYNHEPYIRQAIEGVMMQKTDFEYELVIGEDCSTDKTREICFEYQKRYPDRVRVLWSHENSYLHMHPAGGNYQRTMARCRGEFIAFCEGDDYWTDPRKLQKQVDVMRKHDNVSICFCRVPVLCQETGEMTSQRTDRAPCGVMPGGDVNRALILGLQDRRWLVGQYCMETAGVLFRRHAYEEGRLASVEKWILSYDDLFSFERCLMRGDACFMSDEMAVYRKHESGLTRSREYEYCILRDGTMIRCHLAEALYGLSRRDALRLLGDRIICSICWSLACGGEGYVRTIRSVFACELVRDAFRAQPRKLPAVIMLILLFLHGIPFVRNRLFGLFRRLSGPWVGQGEALAIFRRAGFAVSQDSCFAILP